MAVFLVGGAAGGVLSFALAPPAQALTLSQIEAMLREARSKQQGLNSVVARLDARLSAISDTMQSLNRQLASVNTSLKARQAAYTALQAQLTSKQAELNAGEEQLRWQQMVFNQRVVDSYKTGNIDYIDVLLGSGDFNDMVNRISIITKLASADSDAVAQLTQVRDSVAAEKQDIATKTLAAGRLWDQVKQQHDEVARLRAEKRTTLKSTMAARRAKANALASVNTSISAWEAQEAQLASESQGLSGVIQGLAGSGHGTGTMVWPVHGPITSPFGWRIHPIFHVRKFHTGIDIGASYGTPIHAADGGRVIYATWMSGYGNTTIIDHGNGISTLYAHQSSIIVTSGPVSKGQVIGYVGATGYATGPHLHFEVRVHGNPVNPVPYLP